MLTIGALLTLLVLVGAMGLAVNGRLTAALDTTLHQDLEQIHHIDAVGKAFLELHSRVSPLGHSITSAPPTPDYTPYIMQVDQTMETLHTLPVPQTETLYAQFNPLWRHYMESLPGLLAMPATPERIKYYDAYVVVRYFALTHALQTAESVALARMYHTESEARAFAIAGRQFFLGIFVAAVLLGALLMTLVARSILQPIRTLTASAHQIEQGRLDLVIPVQSHDEIGQLAEAFNSMAAHLRQFRQSDQDKLQRTQQTTRIAINSLPHAVAVLGPTGQIELANDTAQKLFRLQPGATTQTLNLPWLTELFATVAARQRPVEPIGYEQAIQVFDHCQERFFLPHAAPILSDDGRFAGATIVLADATGLRQIDEAKSSLIAAVSHELKTPLTSIQMSLHLLHELKIGHLTAQQTELVEAATEDSQRLHLIIDRLLDAGRLQGTPLSSSASAATVPSSSIPFPVIAPALSA